MEFTRYDIRRIIRSLESSILAYEHQEVWYTTHQQRDRAKRELAALRYLVRMLKIRLETPKNRRITI